MKQNFGEEQGWLQIHLSDFRLSDRVKIKKGERRTYKQNFSHIEINDLLKEQINDKKNNKCSCVSITSLHSV